MSDKSKLGFNINPKNYDELNSTDNLITSGSDSGWLGKKLQGDDSNDLDLSKINPLFDKELYERYRPGVNTNDGSVNQDIWGYKCFNSPVSFRNGIYGDTYSIHSVEDGNKTLGISNGISIQTYQKNTTNNVSTLDNKHYSYNVYFDSEIFGLKENKYIASTYTGNLLVDTFRRTVNNYQLFYNSYVNGSSIENISSRDSNGYSYDYCKLYTFNNPKNTELSIYNGIDIYSKINKNNEYNDEINIASSKCDTSGSRFPYKVSRITVGTDCSADATLEQEQSVSGNCIRMYSANGNEHGVDYTNDNISSIIITPEIINTSIDNKIIAIDYHTSKLTGDDYNYSIPFIDVTFDYTKVTDDPANLILFQINSLLNIQDATTSNTEDYTPSINVYGIFKNANSDIIKYRGTQITPTSITVNAIQFNQLTVGETFISNIHNKLVPVEYIFKQNDNDETGINTYGLKLLGCDSKFKTSFICDYLEVSKSIKCSNIVGIASAAEKLVYVNPTNNAETELLTVSNENLILPHGNGVIALGSADNRFGTIYGDLNGTAVIAEHAATAEQATKDQDGNVIKSSYLNILNFGRNDIESYNAIIGVGERIFFFDEKYFDTNNTIPPIHKSYSSIGTSGTYETECFNLYISKTLSDEDITRTKKCCVAYELKFDSETAIADFSIYPKTFTSDTIESVDSMNIGAPDAPWDEIHCKRFPTIAGTTDTTFVGNIRLLCIKGPASLTTIEHEIKHGSIIKNPMQIGGKQFTIHIANLRIVDNPGNFIGVTGEDDTVEGEWQLLSSALVAANSPSIAVFTPVLAMRVK